ncbi:MAG: hypothetical protein U0228_26950 [Myxococcaceae bacterium]
MRPFLVVSAVLMSVQVIAAPPVDERPLRLKASTIGAAANSLVPARETWWVPLAGCEAKLALSHQRTAEGKLQLLVAGVALDVELGKPLGVKDACHRDVRVVLELPQPQ